MTTEENKAVFRRIWEELFTQGKLAVADEVLAADFRNHALLLWSSQKAGPPGPAPMKYFVTQLHKSFTDVRYVVDDLIAEGDKVSGRITVSGTHIGKSELFAFPPTNKSFRVWHIHIFRFADGKATEHWAVRDDLSVLQQLGLLPTPE